MYDVFFFLCLQIRSERISVPVKALPALRCYLGSTAAHDYEGRPSHTGLRKWIRSLVNKLNESILRNQPPMCWWKPSHSSTFIFSVKSTTYHLICHVLDFASFKNIWVKSKNVNFFLNKHVLKMYIAHKGILFIMLLILTICCNNKKILSHRHRKFYLRKC